MYLLVLCHQCSPAVCTYDHALHVSAPILKPTWCSFNCPVLMPQVLLQASGTPRVYGRDTKLTVYQHLQTVEVPCKHSSLQASTHAPSVMATLQLSRSSNASTVEMGKHIANETSGEADNCPACTTVRCGTCAHAAGWHVV